MRMICSAEIRMSELSRDLKLRLHLLDIANILLRLTQDVLERVDLLGFGIADGEDGASRTFSQPLQNIIVEEFLSHERLSHPLGCAVSQPGRWNAGRRASARPMRD